MTFFILILLLIMFILIFFLIITKYVLNYFIIQNIRILAKIFLTIKKLEFLFTSNRSSLSSKKTSRMFQQNFFLLDFILFSFRLYQIPL